MRRVRYIHWKQDESEIRAERIRDLGYEVEGGAITPDSLKEMRRAPPDAVVIDLERLPAQGRDVGVSLRANAATRNVALVYIGGSPEKVERIKDLLPDAVYTQWSRIRSSLKNAIDNPPEDPVVHRSVLAGYSGVSLPKKLGIKANSTIVLVGAPQGFDETLGELPEDVTIRTRVSGSCDLIIWFTRHKKDLERRIEKLGVLAGRGGLWVVWPKKASGKKTDLTQQEVRRIGLASGLVDYKVCSVDAVWTGLRFTRRRRK